MFKKFFDFIIDSVQAIVFALSIFVLTYLFLAQPNKIKGHSMVPNFQDGELLLTEKVSYRFSSPHHGDVVVFKAPSGEPCAVDQCEYIKRVIGLPGDTVMVQNNRVFVNGKLLPETYLPDPAITNSGTFLKEGMSFIVPRGRVILFGDNRPHSRDSREFGAVSLQGIVGRAFFEYWPLQVMGIVPR